MEKVTERERASKKKVKQLEAELEEIAVQVPKIREEAQQGAVKAQAEVVRAQVESEEQKITAIQEVKKNTARHSRALSLARS